VAQRKTRKAFHDTNAKTAGHHPNPELTQRHLMSVAKHTARPPKLRAFITAANPGAPLHLRELERSSGKIAGKLEQGSRALAAGGKRGLVAQARRELSRQHRRPAITAKVTIITAIGR
jgi:hypothetical protein